MFENDKLIVQVISKTGQYSFDNKGIYFTGGGNGPYYGVRPKANSNFNIRFLQLIVSSKVVDWFLRQISSPFRGGYWSYGKRFIEQLPIRPIDFANPTDQIRHNRMVEMVERMIFLHNQHGATKTSQEKVHIQRQVDALDSQMDRLVYELYDLTEEEIELVESDR